MAVQVVKDLSNSLVTSDGLAACFGLTRPRIIQLANEGVLQRDKNSKYAVQDNIRRFLDYVKNGEKSESSSEEFQADYWEEKALHEKAKRIITESKLGKMQGKIHDAKDVELVMTEILSNLRAQLLGLPSHLAQQLPGKSQDEIYQIITTAIESKLSELCEYSPNLFQTDCEDDDPEDD